MRRTIDMNADVGEGFGIYHAGDDAAIFPWVSSINVACGFHAGDPGTIQTTLGLAKERGVSIGAHPGFPDREGFGRRDMAYSPDDVYRCVLYQIGALFGFARAQGMNLTHVKPHGALYNMAARDRSLADAIAKAVHDFDYGMNLVGLAGSHSIHAGTAIGLKTVSEIFLDRNYESDGSLTPRSSSEAMILDPSAAGQRILDWLETGLITSRTGEKVSLQADTICVHGDTQHAVEMARTLYRLLQSQGIEVRSPY
jgi:5-oxoprolinase (ATP-hydrolysing) subunit A